MAIKKIELIPFIHGLCCIALGLFFVYSGSKKFIPKEPRPVNKEVFIQAIENDIFEKPITFKLCMKMMKVSGFLKLVGILQLLAGVLMLFYKTRLLGLLFLLPITINIFTLHFFMDNRLDEDIKTGLILLTNLVLMAPYFKVLISNILNPVWVLNKKHDPS